MKATALLAVAALTLVCGGDGAKTEPLAGAVFIGDSITHMWDVQRYFGSRVYNRGVNGERSDQVLARFETDALDLKPKAIVLLAGANDIFQALPLTRTKASITKMVSLANRARVPIYVGQLLPSAHDAADGSDVQAKIASANAWLEALCASSNCKLIRYNNALSSGTGKFDETLFWDTAHPNEAGYAKMASAVCEVL